MGEPEEDKLDRILAKDSRYRREAYLFLFQAVEFTVRRLEKRRHVSGQELLAGIRDYASHLYGPMSRLVFEHWGVRESLDFGRIVFSLVDHGLMAKTEDDSLDDFREGFDFKRVFEDEYSWTMECSIDGG